MPSDRSRPLSTRRRARVIVPAVALLGALAIAAPAAADPVDVGGFPGGPYGSFPDVLGGPTRYNGALVAPGPGTVTIQSTLGSYGYVAPQDNGLMLGGPARSSPYFVQSTVAVAPGLSTSFQEAGIFIGTALDSFVKIVAQAGPAGTTRIEMYRAPDPLASGKRVNVDLAGATGVSLTLVANPASGVVVGKYQVLPSGTTQIMGYFPYSGIGPANGGLITSNSGGVNPSTGIPNPPAPAITATFSGFLVGADPSKEIATPPSVSSTTPSGGSTALPTTTNVIANFSKLMDKATLNTNTFVLRGAGGAVVPTLPIEYDIAAGNKPFSTLKPAAALQPGVTYTASLQGDIRDRLGNPLAPVSWSFRTAAPGETPGEIAPATPGGPGAGPGAAGNALTAKFKYTARVKIGKKAKITLTFSRKPNTTVTIQRKSGKRFLKVLSKKVKTKVVSISFPVGKKVGKFTFRAAYKDGKLIRATKTFTIRVVR